MPCMASKFTPWVHAHTVRMLLLHQCPWALVAVGLAGAWPRPRFPSSFLPPVLSFAGHTSCTTSARLVVFRIPPRSRPRPRSPSPHHLSSTRAPLRAASRSLPALHGNGQGNHCPLSMGMAMVLSAATSAGFSNVGAPASPPAELRAIKLSRWDDCVSWCSIARPASVVDAALRSDSKPTEPAVNPSWEAASGIDLDPPEWFRPAVAVSGCGGMPRVGSVPPTAASEWSDCESDGG
mmetsp:Transcript_43462/g.114206  ORF Transcript_43462/g.114206 Transcript_43462/m.114206 type:complete len:236 (-) Transcript_43462:3373-4080(-)